MNLDPIDEKIINHLQVNGYQTGSTIAAELGLPLSTIHRRLKQLKKDKTFIVVVRTNALVLGFKHWVRIGINITPGYTQDVIRRLIENPWVYTIPEVSGHYDLLIGARFKTAEQLITFVENELPALPGVRSAETFIMVKPRKHLQFREEDVENSSNGSDSLDASGGKSTFELDKIDRSILDILTAEGQSSIEQLSHRLGASISTIQRHLKIMADNQVFALDVRVNPELADYEYVVTVGIVVTGRAAQAVLDEIMLDVRYVVNATLCIGRFNIMLSCVFHRYEMIHEYVNVRLNSIQGIHSIESFIHIKRHQYHISQY
jgi:Lrp/AsnC family transcriptional regulator for asnA, asnC and gidA